MDDLESMATTHNNRSDALAQRKKFAASLEITNDELADAADGLIQTSIDMSKYKPGEFPVVPL
ncbi:hypothetical protein [Vibrio sp. Vb0587]|uniref:hypothetical protein n=2 Tax=unclassified Vibrio TaxID=2614977 RepID=UPI0029652C0A|nr:hypothetical protein [Vibrio sp. Vb0587]MDW1968011.1 hypothetical protein [Vibrio sp. Vb0587]